MFKVAADIRYQKFLRQLHAKNLFNWYLEIGSRTGRSLAPARGNAIAVDPFFRINTDVVGPKRSAFFFQMTSDEFFASSFLEQNDVHLSFSFLDGMHLFEVLLRDFINAERNTAPGGAIAMHDCCPVTSEMTTRDHRTVKKGGWTGDVWKLVPILQQYRPDLTVEILGCKPTGLVLVSNISPSSTVLADHYEDIVAQYQDIEFSGSTVEQFFASFEYVPASEFLNKSQQMFESVCLRENARGKPRYVSP